MNPSIILAGASPNILSSLAQGHEVAQRQLDNRHTNDYRSMLQQNGAGIMNGDENALTALAGFDPQAALGVQQTRLGMDATRLDMDVTRERMELARQDAARQAAAHAANMNDTQRQAAGEEYERQMNVLAMAETPEQWDAAVAHLGLQPEQYTFDNRDFYLAESLGVMDALKVREAQTPEPSGLSFRPATPEEAAQYGAVAGQIDMETGRFYPNEPSSTMTLQTTPDGGVIFTQGTGDSPQRGATVDEAKNAGFSLRAQTANETLNALDAEGTSLFNNFAAQVPLGNYALTPEYQRYDQAKRDFVNAVLRRESGAVIADSEFANAERQYFPQPGDTPAVIEQKRQNRLTAIAGMQISSGILDDQVSEQMAGAAAVAMPPSPSSEISDDEWKLLWDEMSEEDRALFSGGAE